VTLHETIARHATLLCERELARRANPREVHDAVRAVTLAVARGLADSAAADATVRQALEAIYLDGSAMGRAQMRTPS
jgi:hypothetical protein